MASCFSAKPEPRAPNGKTLPPVLITRGDVDQHRWMRTDRDAYRGVHAAHINLKRGPASQWWLVSVARPRLRAMFASEADTSAATR